MERKIRFKYLGVWSNWMDFKEFVEATKDIMNVVEGVEEKDLKPN